MTKTVFAIAGVLLGLGALVGYVYWAFVSAIAFASYWGTPNGRAELLGFLTFLFLVGVGVCAIVAIYYVLPSKEKK